MSERRSNREERRSRFRDAVRANSQQQKEQRGSYGYLKLPSGVRTYSPKPGGKAFLDFIPYTVTSERHPDRNDEWKVARPGDPWYRLPFKTHRNIGADNDSVVCLASIGRKCPICEYRSQRMKDGADRNETDALKQSQRNLYCVIPRDDREHEETFHIWDVSQFLFQNLLNDEMEENERNLDFFDTEVGLTLKIRFDEKSFAGNKFAEASRIDFLERDRPLSEKEIKKAPNLDEVLNILPYKELEKLFLGLDDDDVADGTQKPVGGKRKDDDDDRRSTRRSTKDRDDDDDDDRRERRSSRDKDKDEDEDERPSRSRARDRDDDEDRDTRRGTRDRDDDDKDTDEDPPFDKEDKDEKDERKEKETRMSRRSKPDDDKDEKEEKPTRSRRDKEDKDEKEDKRPARSAKDKGGGKDDECPSGHVFGKDTDEFDECNDCPLWEKCLDKKEARK